MTPSNAENRREHAFSAIRGMFQLVFLLVVVVCFILGKFTRNFTESSASYGMNGEILIRVFFGLLGAISLANAAFGKATARWGRAGQGSLIQPQWLGKALEAALGVGFILAAVFPW